MQTSLHKFGNALLALLLLSIIFYGEWVTRPEPEGKRVHVVYWDKYTDFEFKGLKEVVDIFNRAQDRIFVDLLSVSDIKTKTLMATARGNPPDIAGLFGPDIAQYADAHALTPLDGFCKAAGIGAEHYIPIYWDICNYQGHTYALPSAPATTALHYNREMFERAGLDPNKPPKTIEEMDALVEKLTRRDAQGGLEVAGFIHSEPDWWNWGWGYLFGGSLWDGKGNVTANSPANIRAYTWLQSYSKRYGAEKLTTFKSGFGNFSSPQNSFISGKVAMQIQGVWMDNFIRKFNPKMRWNAATFPYPADRPDLANPTFADTDILVIPRGAKHPKEAFEFIKFMQSQKGMEALCLRHHILSPLREVSAEFWKQHPHPYIRLFAEMPKTKNAYFPPKTGIWREYEAEMNSAVDEIVRLEKTPKEALDRVQARMQAKLDAYLKVLRLRGEWKE